MAKSPANKMEVLPPGMELKSTLPPGVRLISVTIPIFVGDVDTASYKQRHIDVNLSADGAQMFNRVRMAQEAILKAETAATSEHVPKPSRYVGKSDTMHWLVEKIAAALAGSTPAL